MYFSKLALISLILNKKNRNSLLKTTNCDSEKKVPTKGVEPSRPLKNTRPSTLHVYQFRHVGKKDIMSS